MAFDKTVKPYAGGFARDAAIDTGARAPHARRSLDWGRAWPKADVYQNVKQDYSLVPEARTTYRMCTLAD
jgi:hypothetical protein